LVLQTISAPHVVAALVVDISGSYVPISLLRLAGAKKSAGAVV
jgi:hypothetical protein